MVKEQIVKSYNWRDRTSNPINRAKRNVKDSGVSEKNIISKQTRRRKNVNYKDLLTIAPGSRLKKGVSSNNSKELRQKNYSVYQEKKMEKNMQRKKSQNISKANEQSISDESSQDPESSQDSF
ncbi:exodeoxyribonuclease 7 large subunit [Acrasis kona]|uniref:Exodeoxyribonuclease 7 large subunit n=1 Tax=Acrasis kona TaxID=1008807 RepID=A0AAW2ZC05_9EUKA